VVGFDCVRGRLPGRFDKRVPEGGITDDLVISVALTSEDPAEILRKLLSLPTGTEWVEFKHNRADPDEIGRYISALSNSAALLGRETAFIVWGVADGTHDVVGTSFKPRQARKGNEELENYITRKLDPRINFKIHEFCVNSRDVVLFEIPPAIQGPVSFDRERYVRVGSYTKNLRGYPAKEAELWAVRSRGAAKRGVSRAVKWVAVVVVLILREYSMPRQSALGICRHRPIPQQFVRLLRQISPRSF